MKKEWVNRMLLVVGVLLLALNLLSSRIERSHAAQRSTGSRPQYKVIVGANPRALEETLNQYTSQGYEFVSWDGAQPLLILKK